LDNCLLLLLLLLLHLLHKLLKSCLHPRLVLCEMNKC